MKRHFSLIVCLLFLLSPVQAFAANVTKVVITATEPEVGKKPSFKASVPESASTEIYEVHWVGEFDNGRFVQGNNYTMTIKLRIKSGSPNIFATTAKINATINGTKARVTRGNETHITVQRTWKTLGGENPNNPKTILRARLASLAASYVAKNTDDDKVLIAFLRSKLPGVEIWSTGVSYKYTRKMPTETEDGSISVPIGITHEGTTLDTYNFTVTLPALNKSPEAARLDADMKLMKTAFNNLIVSATTTGEEILSAVNGVAIHGTKAMWGDNYKYNAPTSTLQGSIDGNLIFVLGNTRDFIRAHKTLPISGTPDDAAIDADFSALSKALHNHVVSNRTTQQELIDLAKASITNGSQLTFAGFTKTDATYENEGEIVIRFELSLGDKSRSLRISMRLSKLRPQLPTGISINQDEWEILRLTNIERYKAGRTPLVIVAPLQDAADIRAKEIVLDYRHDHLRPDGSNFYTTIDPIFLENRKCGENALQYPYQPSVAICSWMHSPGHKANMLKEEYTYFGSGVHTVKTSKYWIQLFASGHDIISAECSTESYHFDTLVDMEMAYVVCTTGEEGVKGYIPLDADYMVKNGNQYTLRLKTVSVTVTVGD